MKPLFIWRYPKVQKTLRACKPGVVAPSCCAAELVENGRLIMVDRVHKTLPGTHLGNVAHAALTRRSLPGGLVRRGVKNFVIPADGEAAAY